MYKTNNARLLVHLWAEIMHSVLDSPPGYTALGPADLGAVYIQGLFSHIVHYLALNARAHVHYLSTMTGHSKILLQSPLIYVSKFSLVRRREQNFAAIPIGLRARCSFVRLCRAVLFARLFH